MRVAHPGGTPFGEGGRAVLAALDAAAAAGRTASAWLMGAAAGALHSRNGRVVGAELDGSAVVATLRLGSGRLTPGEWDDFARGWSGSGPEPPPAVPPARGMGILEWTALTLDATVEGAAELLPAGRGDLDSGPVSQAGAVPGRTDSGRPVDFSRLRREIDRRQSVLALLRPVLTPDSPLARACPQWAGPLQVSAQPWWVLGALADGATARSAARRIGAGMFATTLVVRSLLRRGMVTTTDAATDQQRARRAFPRTLFMDAVRAAG